MTAFVIEKDADPGRGAGLEVSKPIRKLGYRGVETVSVSFDGFHTPASSILGDAAGENAGFYQFMSGIELGRVNVASRAVGIATRAFEEAIAYAQRREAFDKPIAHHRACS